MSGYKHSGFSREEYLGKVGYEAHVATLDELLDGVISDSRCWWPDWEELPEKTRAAWVAAAAAIGSEAQ